MTAAARPVSVVREPASPMSNEKIVELLIAEYQDRPDKLPGRPSVCARFGVKEHNARSIISDVRRVFENAATPSPTPSNDTAPAAPSSGPDLQSSSVVTGDGSSIEQSTPVPCAHLTDGSAEPEAPRPAIANDFPDAGAASDGPNLTSSIGEADTSEVAVTPDQDTSASNTSETASSEPDSFARRKARPSTWLFVLGSVIGIIVSVDTSWRFFEHKAGIENVVERAAMFAGLEIVLIACGVAMFENVRAGRRPGAARWLAWAICGASGYIALLLSGPIVGAARVVLGPVLSVVSFHVALGLELRHARAREHTASLFAQAAAEFKEWVGSWIGLSEQERPAALRRQQRHLQRAAQLSEVRWRPFHTWRLRRALHKAGVAHDPQQRQLLLEEKAVLGSVSQLKQLTLPSPWETSDDPPVKHRRQRSLRLRRPRVAAGTRKVPS